MNFLLGCAVWAYKGWIGEFYPPKSQAGELLHLYSQRLRTVEGNTTFYAIPSSETIAQWKSQMSPGFRFCPKSPLILVDVEATRLHKLKTVSTQFNRVALF